MAGLFTRSRRTRRWLLDLGHRLEAAGLILLWGIAARLPATRAGALGGWLFGHFGPHTRKQRWVLANLRVAFADRPETEIRRLGREIWQNFGATVLEYPHLSTLGRDHLEIVHRHDDAASFNDPRPRIFIGAHLGNFDLMGMAVERLGIAADAVYSPLANPYLERRLQRWRCYRHTRFYPKEKALRSLLRSLRDGRSVGLVVDVRTDEGSLVPFFGVAATTSEAPAWLARRLGCEIVPVRAERLADGTHRVIFYPPLPMPACADDRRAVTELTVSVNRALAGMIVENPGQWWCGKRRWPRQVYPPGGLQQGSASVPDARRQRPVDGLCSADGLLNRSERPHRRE